MHTNRQQMTGSSWGTGMRRRGQILMILLGLLGYWQACQAAEFTCPAGASGVVCLIDAITTANTNGQANTITLVAGNYTLTEADNGTEGDTTGLPVISSPLTIVGAGTTATIIQRGVSTPPFRLMKVAETGSLTLEGLTLHGGAVSRVGNFGGEGGGIFTVGTVTLTNCTLAYNMAVLGGGIHNTGNGTVALTNCTL